MQSEVSIKIDKFMTKIIIFTNKVGTILTTVLYSKILLPSTLALHRFT
jgi:hypothetical protein